jgi:hypothetical protein
MKKLNAMLTPSITLISSDVVYGEAANDTRYEVERKVA